MRHLHRVHLFVWFMVLSALVGPGSLRAWAAEPQTTMSQLTIRSLAKVVQPGIAEDVWQLDYLSPVDQRRDWAWLRPPAAGKIWVVCLHGYGSHGDQLYTRSDLKQLWLSELTRRGIGILTPNLRDDAWMNPEAVADLHALLAYVRSHYGATQFIFLSGSMGGTSNLIYAALHPEEVAGVVALCPATDLASYRTWCREQSLPIAHQIGEAIERAYQGPPASQPKIYAEHSALENAAKLTMPVYIVHGTADQLIPVDQSQRLAKRMQDVLTFRYVEIPNGDHETPLASASQALEWVLSRIRL